MNDNIVFDRKEQPAYNFIEKVELIRATPHQLSNGVPIFFINAGTQDLVKIDFIFDAGSWLQDKNLIASTCNVMLLEGTNNSSSQQIAEKLDFYGAFIQNDSNKHNASVTLFVLNKYLAEVLDILSDILRNSIFPEKDLRILLQNKYQEFIVNNQKNNKIARSRFNNMIFGKQHPYGMSYRSEDFNNVGREDLVSFYENYYKMSNCKIIVSGKITDAHYKIIDKYFGVSDSHSSFASVKKEYEFESSAEKKYYEAKTSSSQTALRMGKRTINMQHPDFNSLYVVNTILGGYFGSRLMSNIREDKGYTYSIGSGLVSLEKTGYFVIVSEVKKEVREQAVAEIIKEVEILRTKFVEESELTRVKNYLMGEILRGIDGAFALSSVFRNILEHNLGYEYYEDLISTVKNITPDRIKYISEQYLATDSLYQVLVG